MNTEWIEGVRSLLEAPSPAVLTTYRKDGSALVSPVWFRWSDAHFEVVIAEGDLAGCNKPGVLLRLSADDPRVWDLSSILPAPDEPEAASG